METRFYLCNGRKGCKPNAKCFMTTDPTYARSIFPVAIYNDETGEGWDKLEAAQRSGIVEEELAKPDEERMECKRGISYVMEAGADAV